MTRGQPPKITPERLARLVALIRGGATISVAAAAVGVTRQTVHHLKTRAPEMWQRIETARAEFRATRHGTETCYVKYGCRRTECVTAATQARGERRDAAGRGRLLPLTPPRDHLAAPAAATEERRSA